MYEMVLFMYKTNLLKLKIHNKVLRIGVYELCWI